MGPRATQRQSPAGDILEARFDTVNGLQLTGFEGTY